MFNVVYSPVCDTDRDSYLRYLEAVQSVNNAGTSGSQAFPQGFSGGMGTGRFGGVRVSQGIGGAIREVASRMRVFSEDGEAVRAGGFVYECGGCCGSDVAHVHGENDSNNGGGGDSGSSTQEPASSSVHEQLGCSGFRSAGGVGCVGKNHERNKKVRAVRKARKAKRQEMGEDWRKRDGGDMIVQDESPGNFWNSTSAEVRQRLIDSKAKMHIAENERRERESRDKLAYYDSPEAAMHKAIAMISYAEKQAKKTNDNKVYGWAKTVATSSAESLARTTPDCVPSFDAYSEELAASSQSSFELALKAKDDEMEAKRIEFETKLEEQRRETEAVKLDAKKKLEQFEVLRKERESAIAKSKRDAVVSRMRELEMNKSGVGSSGALPKVVVPLRPVNKVVPVGVAGGCKFGGEFVSYLDMIRRGMVLPIRLSRDNILGAKSYVSQFDEMPASLEYALNEYDKKTY